MKPISLEVPIKAQSTSNLREHWAQKHERTDAQKAATRRQLAKHERPSALLIVRLTRVAPRPLDDDNLRGALKSVRDAVATWLRVDDRSALVAWEYAQEKVSQKKGAPKVDRVRVEVVAPGDRLEAAPRRERAEWVSCPPEEYGEGSLGEEADGAPAPARPRRLKAHDLAALATPAYHAPKGRP